MGRPRQRAATRHQYSRTDRISESIREIVATELERIGDERLDMVTITNVTVDNDLNTAKVFYSSIVATAEGRTDVIEDGFEAVRHRVQQAVGRGVRARKTPRVTFLPDDVLNAALRIEDIVSGRVEPIAGLTNNIDED